jgi:tRNA 5-methylaminomethyl-2-thiouridine biosynthesis bifunctional protein
MIRNVCLSLHPADVMIQDGTPSSTRFGDVYFSKAGGIDEGRYVFLQGNCLQERFSSACHDFTVAETGFGTGLNLLLVAEWWLEYAPQNLTLHYTSIENHPIRKHDLQSLYANHSFSDAANELLNAYPLLISGVHSRYLRNGRIHLKLIFADIEDALPVISNHSVDAWFLDGFSPAKNPDMWQEAQLCIVGEKTKKDGTFATFTAARSVKLGLEAAGFTVVKRRGYGYKRHMLTGVITA